MLVFVSGHHGLLCFCDRIATLPSKFPASRICLQSGLISLQAHANKNKSLSAARSRSFSVDNSA